jgi:hypothetical protein
MFIYKILLKYVFWGLSIINIITALSGVEVKPIMQMYFTDMWVEKRNFNSIIFFCCLADNVTAAKRLHLVVDGESHKK